MPVIFKFEPPYRSQKIENRMDRIEADEISTLATTYLLVNSRLTSSIGVAIPIEKHQRF